MPLDQPVDPPSSSEKFGHEVRMTFGEHIEELRRRLVNSLIGVLVAAVFTFYFAFDIIGWLAQPFVQSLDALGFPPNTYATDPTLGFGIYMKVALISAAVVAAPWIIYQVWLFVVEGLYQHERRTVHILAPFSVTMTVLAVLFTRYVLLPASLVFFIRFATLYPEITPGEPGWMIQLLVGEQAEDAVGEPSGDDSATPPAADPAPAPPVADPAAPAASVQPPTAPVKLPVLPADPVAPGDGDTWINRHDGKIKSFFNGRTHILAATIPRIVVPLPSLGEYVNFAALVGLGNIVAFQLPVVMLIAGWMGIIPPEDIARVRKYAFFGCAVLSAVLTPADIVSMIVLMVPLYGLFELGLFLMFRVYPREPYPTSPEP